MKNIKLVLLSMLMLIIGCAAPMSKGISVEKGSSRHDFPSLLIQNTGIDVIRIYQNGRRIASVYPGRSECILLRNYQMNSRLSFGHLAGRARWFAIQNQFNRGAGWVWNIDASRPTFSEIDIHPSARCDNGD